MDMILSLQKYASFSSTRLPETCIFLQLERTYDSLIGHLWLILSVEQIIIMDWESRSNQAVVRKTSKLLMCCSFVQFF